MVMAVDRMTVVNGFFFVIIPHFLDFLVISILARRGRECNGN